VAITLRVELARENTAQLPDLRLGVDAQPELRGRLRDLLEAGSGFRVMSRPEGQEDLTERLARQHFPQSAAGPLVGEAGALLGERHLAAAQQHVDDRPDVER
jgi:hypothetical protein